MTAVTDRCSEAVEAPEEGVPDRLGRWGPHREGGFREKVAVKLGLEG